MPANKIWVNKHIHIDSVRKYITSKNDRNMYISTYGQAVRVAQRVGFYDWIQSSSGSGES